MIDFIENLILTSLLAAGSPEAIAQTEASAQISNGSVKTRLGMFSKPLIFGCGATEMKDLKSFAFNHSNLAGHGPLKQAPPCSVLFLCVSCRRVMRWSTSQELGHAGYGHQQELAWSSSGRGLPVCRVQHYVVSS